MVSIVSLALPILVSAVIVFVVSAVIHMFLPYHKNDLRPVGREDELLDAVRRLNLPPGDYAAPHAGSMAGMSDPKFIERSTKGPLIIMTLAPGAPPSMTTSLLLWFLYSIVVGVFAAYIAGRALGPGADYLEVFRFAGASAFMGYSLALLQQSIWFRWSWATTMKNVFDGLIYALLTAGAFGWLWPR